MRFIPRFFLSIVGLVFAASSTIAAAQGSELDQRRAYFEMAQTTAAMLGMMISLQETAFSDEPFFALSHRKSRITDEWSSNFERVYRQGLKVRFDMYEDSYCSPPIVLIYRMDWAPFQVITLIPHLRLYFRHIPGNSPAGMMFQQNFAETSVATGIGYRSRFEALGTEQINGYNTKKYRIRGSEEGRYGALHYWIGQHDLPIRYETITPLGQTTRTLDQIKFGAQDDALFDAPPGYVEIHGADYAHWQKLNYPGYQAGERGPKAANRIAAANEIAPKNGYPEPICVQFDQMFDYSPQLKSEHAQVTSDLETSFSRAVTQGSVSDNERTKFSKTFYSLLVVLDRMDEEAEGWLNTQENPTCHSHRDDLKRARNKARRQIKEYEKPTIVSSNPDTSTNLADTLNLAATLIPLSGRVVTVPLECMVENT